MSKCGKYKYISYGITYQVKESDKPTFLMRSRFPDAYNEFCKLKGCYFKRLFEIVGFMTTQEERHSIIDVQISDSCKMVVFSSFCYTEQCE